MGPDYSINADWELSDADRTWLQTKWFPDQLAAARRLIGQALPSVELPSLDGDLVFIHLHSGLCPDGSKGQFDPNFNFIRISWPWDFVHTTGRISRHEFAHKLLWNAGHPRYTTFGHGTNAWANDDYLLWLHTQGREVYFKGSAYDPLATWPL